MKTALFSILTAALVALGLAGGTSHAQTQKQADLAGQPAKSAGQKLNDQSLLAMLEGLGYSPKLDKVGNRNFYWIKVKQGGIDFSISLQVYASQDRIFLFVPLADFPKDRQVATDRVMKVLELNDSIGPCYFVYNKNVNRLFMARGIDNRELTPLLLRKNLDAVLDRAVETKGAWNHNKWAEPITPVATANGLGLLETLEHNLPADPVAATATAEDKLTNESLQTILQTMGYTPEVIKLGHANAYILKIKNAGMESIISVQLSPNSDKLWLIASLVEMPKDGNIAADRVLDLLALNDTIGPCFFRYSKGNNVLSLNRVCDNRAITAAVMRENIEQLLTRLVETKNAWNHNQWGQPK